MAMSSVCSGILQIVENAITNVLQTRAVIQEVATKGLSRMDTIAMGKGLTQPETRQIAINAATNVAWARFAMMGDAKRTQKTETRIAMGKGLTQAETR